MKNLERFLDNEGKVKIWPAKKEHKLEILIYISEKFDTGRFYSEKEANAIINEWHTFGDYFLIRRGMIEASLLSRIKNGSRYWREEAYELPSIISIIDYNFEIGKLKSVFRFNNGYGSACYYLLSDKGEYVLKDIENNQMNHPENEMVILDELANHGIPVSEFIKNKNDEFLLHEGNKVLHLQKYIPGTIYNNNSIPEWLLFESARTLGRIQSALEILPPLPVGISQSFFDNMTPQYALSRHNETLDIAYGKDDKSVINAIKDKIKLISEFKGMEFDLSRMTCKNTHGDYKVNQLICGNEKINAVIDFTSACIHPVCWEVIRSYCLADVLCKNGEINIENFKEYIDCFLEKGSLNSYDLKIMPYLFYYQNLISDYFGQFYNSKNSNRNNLLNDAFYSIKLCKWFDKNLNKLEYELKSSF